MGRKSDHTGKLSGILLALILVVVSGPLSAQEISSSVVNNTGFEFTESSELILSSSLGETAVATLSAGDVILTQGFLQPELQLPCGDLEISFFPNPVIDEIEMEVLNCNAQLTRVEVFDLFGKSFRFDIEDEMRVDLSDLSTGIYIVKAYTDRGVNQSFKIAKVAQ